MRTYRCRSMVLVISCASLLQLAGCAASVEESTLSAPSIGFVAEMDEPSGRGNVSRITPDQLDVQYRFVVSPEGKEILFSALASGVTHEVGGSEIRHLWRMPLAGGSPMKVTSGGDVDCDYGCYTPDGKSIVYSAGGNLWKIQVNGSGGRIKLGGSGVGYDTAPDISKTGRIIFCSSTQSSDGSGYYSPRYFIWMCNADGGNLTQLREGSFPRWSPDGEHLVFEYNSNIWTMRTDGTELLQLTSSPKVVCGLPAYSDDGKKIVFTSNEGSEGRTNARDFNIWIMNADGSQRTKLTDLPSWDSWPLVNRNGMFFLSARAATSKSGNYQRIWRMQLAD